MTRRRWTQPARISLSGPEGWAPVERMTVQHLDGDALVSVETWPVRGDADVDDLASAHGRRLGVPADSEDSGLVPRTVLGASDGRTRTVRWADGSGTERIATVEYALDAGRMTVVTSTAPADDQEKRAAAADIAASVRLTRRAPSTAVRPAPATTSVMDLGGVAQAWLSDGAAAASAVGATHVITMEESFAAARHFGVAMFPGADAGPWMALEPAQRDVACDVAWRSLVVRGALDDPAFVDALEIAASHSFILTVAVQGAGRRSSTWYAARPDRGVRITPTGDATLRLATFDTQLLADVVLAGVREDPSAALPDMEARVSVSSVYRRDGAVCGRETGWAITDSGSAADANGTPLTTGMLRHRLAGLLPEPGADEQQGTTGKDRP